MATRKRPSSRRYSSGARNTAPVVTLPLATVLRMYDHASKGERNAIKREAKTGGSSRRPPWWLRRG